MDKEFFIDKSLSFLSKWWLSMILIFCSWFIIEQFYIAVRYNVFYAVRYTHVFGFSMIYFLIDNLTLIIHEAGHTIFGIFGWRFLTVLGGTLMQLLIPFSVVLYGWINRKTFTTQLGLYWLGFAWLDTAAYCADAYQRALPLIGNLPKSAHDFYNLLSHVNALSHYKEIAYFIFSIGCVVLLVSIFLPLFTLNTPKKVNLDLGL